MIYDFLENQTLDTINQKANEGWEIFYFDKQKATAEFEVGFRKGISEPYVLVESTPDTTANFYLEKTITYGDIVLFVFLTIFLIWFIIGGIWRFVFPFNFKK